MTRFETSLGPCVPARIGAVTRAHRVWQAWRKEGSVRDAAEVSESWTALQKRGHRKSVSSEVVVGKVGGGVAETILTKSVFE